jgi:hypothetical protein
MTIKEEVEAENKEPRLWFWFSKFIRLRDSVEGGMCACKACGRVKPYKEMDAGHFISRRWKPTKYREDNVFAECVNCNRDLSGNLDEYAIALGPDKVAELKDASRQPARKMWPSEVKTLTDYYRKKAQIEAKRVGVEL